ncbi:hypothetical protein JKP88DRAFT_246383 [Tribonema minus]|uniref:Uncharacterized protein n=1 Tax=Tribonema minus TaxID=303371 RepID=A0A835YW51_9STRA|nr:hypothetical protein JKP88DRAFT_246383 [Tribonema minus]
MAERRLLPKNCWSLNKVIHDTVAPTVTVHLVAGSAALAIPHHLLEDTTRRHVVTLTMDGDFTSTQERPLSLPPSLVRLSLRGFRGELGPVPSGLRELHICAYRNAEGNPYPIYHPHPLLADITNSDAVQRFLQEMSEITVAVLPTVRLLCLVGMNTEDFILLRTCMQALCKVPHPKLKDLRLYAWTLHWEDLLQLLSPPAAVQKVTIENCHFTSDSESAEGRFTIPSLPEGLVSLEVARCHCGSEVMVISRLPESLRHVNVAVIRTDVEFAQPLPPLLESFSLKLVDVHANISAGMLPASLRVLELVGRHLQLEEVPPSLRVLKLRAYKHPLPQLPDTLETLVLDECKHHVAEVPDSVRSLSLCWCHPHPAPPLPARWPTHLERLIYWGESDEFFGTPHDMPHIDSLPPTLRRLELNGCAVMAELPQALQELRLGCEFRDTVNLKDFTGSVTVSRRRVRF